MSLPYPPPHDLHVDVPEMLMAAGAVIHDPDDRDEAVAVIRADEWARLMLRLHAAEMAGGFGVTPTPYGVGFSDVQDLPPGPFHRVEWGDVRVLILGCVEPPEDVFVAWETGASDPGSLYPDYKPTERVVQAATDCPACGGNRRRCELRGHIGGTRYNGDPDGWHRCLECLRDFRPGEWPLEGA